MSELMTADEVARLLRLPLQSVWTKAREGALPGVVHVGRLVRFRPEAITGYIAAGGSVEAEADRLTAA